MSGTRLTARHETLYSVVMIDPLPKYTPEAYLALERAAPIRSELVDGEIVAMSGASFRHNRINLNLAGILNGRLRPTSCQVCSNDLRVLAPHTALYTYPDVVVVCGLPRFQDDQLDTLLNPTLLAEVLSPTTESFDRGRKFAQYQEIESLAEYLLVAQDEARIEQFVRQPDGLWTYRAVAGRDATLELPSVGVTLSLSEVYDKVELS